MIYYNESINEHEIYRKHIEDAVRETLRRQKAHKDCSVSVSFVDRDNLFKPKFRAQGEVFCSAARGDVNGPRAIGCRYIVPCDDFMFKVLDPQR